MMRCTATQRYCEEKAAFEGIFSDKNRKQLKSRLFESKHEKPLTDGY